MVRTTNEQQIRVLLANSAGVITTEGLAEVRHFLDHGEYEMAFEGLILELMESKATPANFKSHEWLELAKCFGLQKESVFTGNFWERFVSWLESRGS